MSKPETQLPPSPEQMAVDITAAIISAGYFKGLSEFSNADPSVAPKKVKALYKHILAEFKKV